MKFINNDFVSREYYEGACAYYQEAITRLTEENKLYETKLRKITEFMGLFKTLLNDCAKLRTITECMELLKTLLNNYSIVTDKIGRFLDGYEMF